MGLQIVPGISFRRLYKILDVFCKSQYHVYNNGGAHSYYRCVNKILPDAGWCYVKFLANGRTYSKGIPFNKISDTLHRDLFSVN